MFRRLTAVLLSLLTISAAVPLAISPLAMAAQGAGGANNLFAAGFELLKKKSYSEARGKFLAGLNLDATSALAHFYLAQCDEALGNVEEARREYMKSLELQPTSTVANQARAALAAFTKGLPEATNQKPAHATSARNVGSSAELEDRLRRAFSYADEHFDKVDDRLNLLYTRRGTDGRQWSYDICSLTGFYWGVAAQWNGTLADTHLSLKSERCSGQVIGEKAFTSCHFDLQDSGVNVMGTVDALGQTVALTDEDVQKAVRQHFAHGKREDAQNLKASLEDLQRVSCTPLREAQAANARDDALKRQQADALKNQQTELKKKQAELDRLNAQFMKH